MRGCHHWTASNVFTLRCSRCQCTRWERMHIYILPVSGYQLAADASHPARGQLVRGDDRSHTAAVLLGRVSSRQGAWRRQRRQAASVLCRHRIRDAATETRPIRSATSVPDRHVQLRSGRTRRPASAAQRFAWFAAGTRRRRRRREQLQCGLVERGSQSRIPRIHVPPVLRRQRTGARHVFRPTWRR